MTVLWPNPEFLRNARAQLRPGKVAATAIICSALSVVIGYAISHQIERQLATGPYGWGIQILQTAFWLQALMLAAGGGIACINSIHREKEQNTFDYQRVTRMTPLELALGKLFGAPVFTYFVFLCLMPLALFGAVMAKRSALTVAAAYAVLLIASLAVHTLALLISLLTVRGSHTAAILVLLVILTAGISSNTGLPSFQVHPFGPFYAAKVIEHGEWQPIGTRLGADEWGTSWDVDVFFGQRVQHVPLLLAIDLMFAWRFLLALARNIKRDPNYYEIYSPVQALGFAMFLNLLFVAFYEWGHKTLTSSQVSLQLQRETPIQSQATLLTLNILVFSFLGLGAIRNRDRMRRILRFAEGRASWLDLAWPAPLILAGTLAAGLLIVLGVAKGRDPQVQWSANFALLRVLFFASWFARDMQFLQWMNLRRGKHPLVMGLLFLLIFYVCALIMMAALQVFTLPEREPFSAFFVPSAVYLLDHLAWMMRPAIWASVLVAQWFLIAVFIALQKKTIDEFNALPTRPADVPLPAQT